MLDGAWAGAWANPLLKSRVWHELSKSELATSSKLGSTQWNLSLIYTMPGKTLPMSETTYKHTAVDIYQYIFILFQHNRSYFSHTHSDYGDIYVQISYFSQWSTETTQNMGNFKHVQEMPEIHAPK